MIGWWKLSQGKRIILGPFAVWPGEKNFIGLTINHLMSGAVSICWMPGGLAALVMMPRMMM